MMTPAPRPIFVVPGMHVGCMPYEALSSSSLECFFSPTCLNDTARWISNLPAADWPKPLKRSQLNHFLPNTSIGSLMDQQMADKWDNTLDYDAYYRACSPMQCTYTAVGHNSLLYIITLLVGLCGGFNILIRTVSPFIVKVGYLMHSRLKKGKSADAQSLKTGQGAY